MEIKHIKELMAVMQRTGTKRLVIKREGVELELERQDQSYKMIEPALDLLDENPMRSEMAQHRANMMLAKGSDVQSMVASPGTQKSETADTNSLYITSPMVGTFYSTPSPEEPPYVKVGDTIGKDSLVGIIEAMKVMNEIRAGISGVVAEILVENGHPVEFGTKLYRIK